MLSQAKTRLIFLHASSKVCASSCTSFGRDLASDESRQRRILVWEFRTMSETIVPWISIFRSNISKRRSAVQTPSESGKYRGGTDPSNSHKMNSLSQVLQPTRTRTIRAADVAFGLGRIPDDIYTAMIVASSEWRTDIDPLSLDNDIVKNQGHSTKSTGRKGD